MNRNCAVVSFFTFSLGITYSFRSELEVFMFPVNIVHKNG